VVRTTMAGVAALVSLGVGTARAGDPAGAINVGVVGGMFKDVPPALVNALGQPFKNLIRRDTGVTGEFKLVADATALADQLRANQCQLGVFHGYEFAWAKARNPNLMPLVVTEYRTGRPQAAVVVNVDSKATGIDDLKADAIVIPKGTRGHCLMYVAKEHDGVKASGKPPEQSKTDTAEALDGVVSGTVEAAVVDVQALVGYETLQPGAFKNLRILAKSAPFPQNVIAYDKSVLDEATAAKLRTTLVTAHTTAAGKPLMLLWNMKNFAAVPADYDAHLASSAKDYPAPAATAPVAAGSGSQ